MADVPVFVCPSHGLNLMSRLRTQYEKGLKCDLYVQVKGTCILAHRCVVTAFMKTAVVTLADEVYSLNLETYNASTVKPVLDFIYNGKLVCSKDQVSQIRELAEKLGFAEVEEGCKAWLSFQAKQKNSTVTPVLQTQLQKSETEETASPFNTIESETQGSKPSKKVANKPKPKCKKTVQELKLQEVTAAEPELKADENGSVPAMFIKQEPPDTFENADSSTAGVYLNPYGEFSVKTEPESQCFGDYKVEVNQCIGSYVSTDSAELGTGSAWYDTGGEYATSTENSSNLHSGNDAGTLVSTKNRRKQTKPVRSNTTGHGKVQVENVAGGEDPFSFALEMPAVKQETSSPESSDHDDTSRRKSSRLRKQSKKKSYKSFFEDDFVDKEEEEEDNDEESDGCNAVEEQMFIGSEKGVGAGGVEMWVPPNHTQEIWVHPTGLPADESGQGACMYLKAAGPTGPARARAPQNRRRRGREPILGDKYYKENAIFAPLMTCNNSTDVTGGKGVKTLRKLIYSEAQAGNLLESKEFGSGNEKGVGASDESDNDSDDDEEEEEGIPVGKDLPALSQVTVEAPPCTVPKGVRSKYAMPKVVSQQQAVLNRLKRKRTQRERDLDRAMTTPNARVIIVQPPPNAPPAVRKVEKKDSSSLDEAFYSAVGDVVYAKTPKYNY